MKKKVSKDPKIKQKIKATAKKETKPKTKKTKEINIAEHRLGLIVPEELHFDGKDSYINTDRYSASDKYIVFDIETTGLLMWEHDKITCICAKTHEGIFFEKALKKSVAMTSDMPLISDFIDFLKRHPASEGYKLITQYGKQFDVPFILSRLAQNTDHFFDETLNIIKSYRHIDLKEIDPSSLKDKARRLNLNISKNGTGLNAIDLANKGKWKELREYCMQDVEVTERVYIKFKSILN